MTAPAGEQDQDATAPKPGPQGESEKTFTQSQLNAILAQQRREVESKFPDYADLKSRAQQYDALEDSVKSDVQRANDSAAEFKVKAESEAASSAAVKLENLRYRISAKKGLDPELWDRVTGATEEEIEADVDKLVTKFSAPERKSPIGALRSGASTASNAGSKAQAAAALRSNWQQR